MTFNSTGITPEEDFSVKKGEKNSRKTSSVLAKLQYSGDRKRCLGVLAYWNQGNLSFCETVSLAEWKHLENRDFCHALQLAEVPSVHQAQYMRAVHYNYWKVHFDLSSSYLLWRPGFCSNLCNWSAIYLGWIGRRDNPMCFGDFREKKVNSDLS